MEPLTFTHTMNADDYGKFFIFAAFERKTFNRIFINYFMPVFGILMLMISIIAQSDSVSLYFLIAFVILFGPLFRLLYRFVGRNAFNKTPLLGLENTYSFLEDMIVASNERGELKYYYTDIYQVSENKKYLFIQFGGQLFFWFSKERLGDKTIDSMIRFLVKKVPEKCKLMM